jgi:hypothetical protein
MMAHISLNQTAELSFALNSGDVQQFCRRYHCRVSITERDRKLGFSFSNLRWAVFESSESLISYAHDQNEVEVAR